MMITQQYKDQVDPECLVLDADELLGMTGMTVYPINYAHPAFSKEIPEPTAEELVHMYYTLSAYY